MKVLLFITQGLKVTMKKHPSCFKLSGPLKARNEAVQSEVVVLYDGRCVKVWNSLFYIPFTCALMCSFRKYSYLPDEGSLEVPRGEGV